MEKKPKYKPWEVCAAIIISVVLLFVGCEWISGKEREEWEQAVSEAYQEGYQEGYYTGYDIGIEDGKQIVYDELGGD